MRLATAIALCGSTIASCAGPQPPSDAEIIAAFERDWAGYEEIVRLMSTDPRITFVGRGAAGAWTVEPAADAGRVAKITDFLGRHDIKSVGAIPEGPPVVGFVVSAQGLAVSGRAKSIEYDARPAGEASDSGRPVADTDVAMREPSDRWRVVRRDIGDGWFVRHACC